MQQHLAREEEPEIKAAKEKEVMPASQKCNNRPVMPEVAEPNRAEPTTTS